MAVIGFTPASGADAFSFEPKPSITKTNTTFSGEEARLFYESLLNDGTGSRHRDGHEIRPRTRVPSVRQGRRLRTAGRQPGQPESPAQRRIGGPTEDRQMGERSISARSSMLQGLRLLRYAHEGNIPELRELLSRGVDINFQDSFLWTAMMCACWSGQTAAVRLLLHHGAAWVGVVDMQGRDAKDLAQEAGHSEVLEELFSFGRNTQRISHCESSSHQPQWCNVCRCELTTGLSSHISSTVHQFSLRRAPPTPNYCLPSSSNSYQMMLRCGWKPGTGLGPEGEGTKQPVATVLKRDQAGLGYGQTRRARVTHFAARNQEAVKSRFRRKEERKQKRQVKEEFQRKENSDKNWERDFRTSFYL
ncbi:G patch domain and ankyrin repeat-containing protein 1 [Gouania willdenowi]|uniref:G patch domain and ankyrin repeat-containing protein 1 n=1 Tax=Gouania willdenowi TaxID=441366 RepID=UPI0010545D5D|nr:G patch domain and ankyrin repeat-containing protein 1 [Gouania willdenowi]XP_028305827.1 G patch domain and ankyrin repeat-containing protein 1 [Gouania willdenowi]